MDFFNNIRNALAPYGLNLIGTAAVTAYEALVPQSYYVRSLLPGANSLVVIGSGGREFWQGFRAYGEMHPGYVQTHEHPLDDYTVEILEQAVTPVLDDAGAQYRYLYPFRFWTEPVSFMHLARAAGIAGPSILGITIHPHYGPWMALRAAILLDQSVFTEPVAADFDPCPSCVERPCITSCPASAISPEKNWDVPTCVHHRLRVATDCVDYCHARYECVYGRAYRYPLDELQYHQQRSFAEMRKYFAQKEGK
ncbi:MAG: hypothetical protein AB7G75_09780 [Candidatus Binatia bacterium]